MYNELLIQSSTIGYLGGSNWSLLKSKPDGHFGSKGVHISLQKFPHLVQTLSKCSETLDEILFLVYTTVFILLLMRIFFFCLKAFHSIFRLSR